MNKKIYLLSFAAAAMFASCSNEMEEFKILLSGKKCRQ